MSDEEKKPHPGRFVKGHDARRNIGGRKSRDELGRPVIELARSMGVEMLMIQANIARDETVKPADRSKAAERVLTRAFGAPKTTVEIQHGIEEHHVHHAVDVSLLSTDLKRELLAAMLRQEETIDADIIEEETSEKLAIDHDKSNTGN